MQQLLKCLRLHGKEFTLKIIEQFVKNKEINCTSKQNQLRQEMIDFIESVS